MDGTPFYSALPAQKVSLKSLKPFTRSTHARSAIDPICSRPLFELSLTQNFPAPKVASRRLHHSNLALSPIHKPSSPPPGIYIIATVDTCASCRRLSINSLFHLKFSVLSWRHFWLTLALYAFSSGFHPNYIFPLAVSLDNFFFFFFFDGAGGANAIKLNMA